MSGPWRPVSPLSDADFARLRRRAIFDCCKWDPQVEDTCVIARQPLVVSRQAWADLVPLAESLARETLAAEAELIGRPELHAMLGLPRAVRRALRDASVIGPTAGAARIIRFDFHDTGAGWQISEANTDVPGGLNEASGFPQLMQPHYPGTQMTVDPVDAYIRALLDRAGAGGVVALLHATAYSDDQQMMRYVAKRLQAAGARAHLASPSHVRWRGGRASLHADWWQGPLDLVVRFFPAEWLSSLPAECGWPCLFAGGATPVSNPASALLTQSKRFPLVWSELDTPLPTWRRLLPETRDPRDAPSRTSDCWVLKPALGRVGEGVAVPGTIDRKQWTSIRRAAAWRPGRWVAQRRFDARSFEIGGACLYPCLGIYTVNERVAGAYGRFARRPLVDAWAEDAGVLLMSDEDDR